MQRTWKIIEQQDKFVSVMSYNILAPSLVEQHPHLYNRGRHMQWYKRLEKIAKQIKREKCDIVMLQELEFDAFKKFQQRVFDEHGYQSIYQKRKGEQKDGLGIYVNPRFKILQHKKLDFTSVEAGERPNVAIIALLECQKTKELLLIGTVHLLWNPKRGDIKIKQLQSLFKEMEQMRPNPLIPVLVGGDFNTTPDSKIYDFLCNGSVDIDKNLLPNYWSGQLKHAPTIPQETNHFEHPFQFHSAYAPHRHNNGTNYITTSHKDSQSTVDYLFTNGLKPLRILEPKMNVKSMPNESDPSDHFYLVGEFSFGKYSGNLSLPLP
ncbi:Endonuclease/exonuclease/phosphatase [Gorgonomyces haynaldii]|nr:Endonuclease/exonuclease/phosphatase [Gorgonomyces haynaldii]